MKDKLLFLLYLLAVFFISLLSSVKLLAVLSLSITFALFLLPIKRRLSVLKRAIYVCLAFNLLVSLPYFLLGFWLGQDRSEYILMMSLRSFSITLTTFTFFRIINLFKALDFSKSLSFLLVIVSAHLLIYANLMEEFGKALKSRTLKRPNGRAKLNFYERVLSFFFEKSVRTSEGLHQAMKSRGFHD